MRTWPDHSSFLLFHYLFYFSKDVNIPPVIPASHATRAERSGGGSSETPACLRAHFSGSGMKNVWCYLLNLTSFLRVPRGFPQNLQGHEEAGPCSVLHQSVFFVMSQVKRVRRTNGFHCSSSMKTQYVPKSTVGWKATETAAGLHLSSEVLPSGYSIWLCVCLCVCYARDVMNQINRASQTFLYLLFFTALFLLILLIIGSSVTFVPTCVKVFVIFMCGNRVEELMNAKLHYS